jgi:hypothetical protein
LEILGVGSGKIASWIVGDVSKHLRRTKAAIERLGFAYFRIAGVLICLQIA